MLLEKYGPKPFAEKYINELGCPEHWCILIQAHFLSESHQKLLKVNNVVIGNAKSHDLSYILQACEITPYVILQAFECLNYDLSHGSS